MTPFSAHLYSWLYGERSDRDDELPDADQLIGDFEFMRKNGAPGIPEDVAGAVREGLDELLEAGRVEVIGGRWRWRPEKARPVQGALFA